jgi:hypothetical protein
MNIPSKPSKDETVEVRSFNRIPLTDENEIQDTKDNISDSEQKGRIDEYILKHLKALLSEGYYRAEATKEEILEALKNVPKDTKITLRAEELDPDYDAQSYGRTVALFMYRTKTEEEYQAEVVVYEKELKAYNEWKIGSSERAAKRKKEMQTKMVARLEEKLAKVKKKMGE